MSLTVKESQARVEMQFEIRRRDQFSQFPMGVFQAQFCLNGGVGSNLQLLVNPWRQDRSYFLEPRLNEAAGWRTLRVRGVGTRMYPADHSKLTLRVPDDNGFFAQTFGVPAKGMNGPSVTRMITLH